MRLLHHNFSIGSIKFIVLVLLLNISCNNEKSNIDYDFQSIETLYFPQKDVSVVFNIIQKGNNQPFATQWINPDSLKEEGPYNVSLTSNLLLEFEIFDAEGFSKRFKHELTTTSDSLKYDFRNKCVGAYSCSVTYSYEGTTKFYSDTLTVLKHDDFRMLNILTRSDISNKFAGNRMTYLFRFNGNSKITFYGYHSGVSFSNDSIHYSPNGPLGYYYSTVYKGVRIK